MHFFLIYLIIVIYMVSVSVEKAVDYDEMIHEDEYSENINYINVSNPKYHNPFVDKKFYTNQRRGTSLPKKLIFKKTVGNHCDDGTHKCSMEFEQLGPFSFEGYKECYIHRPFSGPDDKKTGKGNGFQKIFMDINGQLKCVVNGQTYNEVQRVSIFGFSDRLPEISNFPTGRTLSRGVNSFPNSKHLYYIWLGDCTSVWSYNKNSQFDCQCDTIAS